MKKKCKVCKEEFEPRDDDNTICDSCTWYLTAEEAERLAGGCWI